MYLAGGIWNTGSVRAQGRPRPALDSSPVLILFILSNQETKASWYCRAKEELVSSLAPAALWKGDQIMGGWAWIEMTNGGSSTNVEVYFNKT